MKKQNKGISTRHNPSVSSKTATAGITLIALVITIIVLLILAGVSIATLTGENGILTRADNAKTETTKAETIERVRVEVAGSYGINGKIDIDELNKNLKNIKGLTYKGQVLSDTNTISDWPAKVKLNGYEISIKSNGEVEENLEWIIAEIIANPKAYYGKKVTNYKNDGNTYRIFYVDKENYFGDGVNTIYLKADYSGTVYCSTIFDESLTKMKAMNPLWTEKRGDVESSSWRYGEKAAAWLCDPSKWTEYCDTEKANYAIGGPSVEMYVKSYNQAYEGMLNSNIYPLGTIYRDTNVPGYIYTLNGAQSTISNKDYMTGAYSIDYIEYNSMYCGQNGSNVGKWWLASPSGYVHDNVCIVNGKNPGLHASVFNAVGQSASPIVSLRSDFIPKVEE